MGFGDRFAGGRGPYTLPARCGSNRIVTAAQAVAAKFDAVSRSNWSAQSMVS